MQHGQPRPTGPSDEQMLAMMAQMAEGMRKISDMLKGCAAELEREGWTPEQAKEIAVATWVGSSRGH